VPILYGGEDVNTSALAGEPGADASIYQATAYSPQGLTDRGKEFARHYEERFQEPPDLAAAEAYDGACLLLDVLHRAQEARGDRIRQELANTQTFQSVTGPVSWKDRVPRRRVFVVRLGGGETRVVRTVEPEGE
jgi:branched-chain amino acid transport system substrate-binding protein